MSLTSEIFKIASDFLSDLAINFAKKGIQKLTKPLIEEMVKEYAEKQPKNPSNTTVNIDNSVDNSIHIITEEVFSIMQIDNRFVMEDDYITVDPIALEDSQTYFSDIELWEKIIALQETIKRRKLEQERRNLPKDISENLNALPAQISLLSDENMDTTFQNLSPTPKVPKLQDVSESKVTVELNAPDVKKLKLLQPAKPIEPLMTPPEIDDSQDEQPLSRSDYLKQKVINIQSRIKVRKVEQGEE